MAGLDLQLKVRQNAEELGDFLKDLDRWETDIKKKDEELKSSTTVLKKALPPVRNQRRKKNAKKKVEKPTKDVKDGTNRLSSYDYNAWDKFDVDEELKKLEENEEMKTVSTSEEDTSDEEDIEEERRLQKALLEKDKGNDFFKEGKYEAAISRYTIAIQLDPSNAVFPANRAMALLKVQRFGAAEEDCNTAIALDVSYTKAYLRRGAARVRLEKLKEALDDYKKALRLEPENKQAKHEIVQLKQKLENGKVSTSKTDTRDARELKSKKPFKRIQIDEIGSDSSEDENTERDSCGATRDHTEKSKDGFGTEKDDNENNKKSPKITEIPSSADPGTGSTETTKSPEVTEEKKPKEGTKTSPKNSNIKNKIYEIPKTSIQLEKDWKELKNKPNQLFEYFEKISPKAYSKLFQQAIDSDMLSAIISLLHDYYIPAKMPVYNELEGLAQVQRFGMTAMFLSASDKKVLQNLFTYIKDNIADNGSPSETRLEAVMKKYCL